MAAVTKDWNFANKVASDFAFYEDWADFTMFCPEGAPCTPPWNCYRNGASDCTIVTGTNNTPNGEGKSADVWAGNAVLWGSDLYSDSPNINLPARDDYYLIFSIRPNDGLGAASANAVQVNYTVGGFVNCWISPIAAGADYNLICPDDIWYTFIIPISDKCQEKYGAQRIISRCAIVAAARNARIQCKFIGVFRASQINDDYCINWRCGYENKKNSAFLDLASGGGVYLADVDSDLTLTEDIDVSEYINGLLTIYHTLGDGMQLKATISWEIGGVVQTDAVFYGVSGSTTHIYLSSLCLGVDKVTKIKIENVSASPADEPTTITRVTMTRRPIHPVRAP